MANRGGENQKARKPKTTKEYDIEIEELRKARKEARARVSEEYDRKIELARNRKRTAAAREASADRKAENHAKFVAGGLLLSCIPGGWKSVDWDALAESVHAHSPEFANDVIAKGVSVSTEDAKNRLREWERHERENPDSESRYTERVVLNHAETYVGRLVLSCFHKGWKSVNWNALANFIRAIQPNFEQRSVEWSDGNEPSAEEASEEFRKWETKYLEMDAATDSEG